ncbi:adhesion regulating molecule 1 [Nesidiocoris tenuis]|nr:adhesion regulating molecule 1 [Nesidiocoris tenuis]
MTGGFPLWPRASPSRRNRLLEFKAGKMYMIGNMVYPDPRKGLVYLYQDDFGTVHLCWMDRITGTVEDDYHTEPMDCTYQRIEKCKTGRVYVLKMKKTKRTMFFWMQEPKMDRDAFIAARVINLLDFPPAMIAFPDRVSVPGHGEVSLNALRLLLNRITSEARAVPGQNDDIVWVDVRGQPAGSGYIESRPNVAQSTSMADQEQQNASPPPPVFVNLTDIVTEESIRSLHKPKYLQKIGSKLPPVSGESNNLEKTLKSSQFREAFEDFSLALKSGTLGHVLKDYGVNRAAVSAAEVGDVDQFVKALQEHQTRPRKRSVLKNSDKPPGNSDKEKDQKNSPGRKSDGSQSSKKENSPEGAKDQGGPKNSKDGAQKEEEIGAGKSTQAVQESQQQTEPVQVRPAYVPPEKKIAVKRPERVNNSAGAADASPNRDRGQNTDPVRIKADPKSNVDLEKSKTAGPDEKK